jgi:hypothetical protein
MPYSGYNSGAGGLVTKAINSIKMSGSDAMTNMYDVKIFFPDENGNSDTGMFETVRSEGFKIPEVAVGTYELKYHGVTIKRPKTEQTFNRTVEMSFRLDSGFDILRRLTAWQMMLVDPVTGGVTNTAQFLGKIEVQSIVGAYFATTLAAELEGPTDAGDDPLKAGAVAVGTDNPLAIWRFYDVWPEKVGQPEFKREDAGLITLAVTFNFADCDIPYFGGNPLAIQK